MFVDCGPCVRGENDVGCGEGYSLAVSWRTVRVVYRVLKGDFLLILV